MYPRLKGLKIRFAHQQSEKKFMMPSMIKQKWWVVSVTIGFICFETILSRITMAFKKPFLHLKDHNQVQIL